MALFRHLQQRRERLQQQQSFDAEREAAETRRQQQLIADAAVLRDLVQDARYARYVQLLTDVRDGLQRELDQLLATAVNAEQLALSAARLRGRIYQIELIVQAPAEFAALADQCRTPEGNGRHTVPTISGHPAS